MPPIRFALRYFDTSMPLLFFLLLRHADTLSPGYLIDYAASLSLFTPDRIIYDAAALLFIFAMLILRR